MNNPFASTIKWANKKSGERSATIYPVSHRASTAPFRQPENA
nr:hypothetical protein [uncultured Kingella sp.]